MARPLNCTASVNLCARIFIHAGDYYMLLFSSEDVGF